jgi:hypothetical protein
MYQELYFLCSMVDLYNTLICAYEKSNVVSCMARITHTIVSELSRNKVIISRSNNISLSSTSSKFLPGTAREIRN